MTDPTTNQSRRAALPPGKHGEVRPNIGGVTVREEDIEPVQGLRSVALLFRGLSALLVALMIAQIIASFMSEVPPSIGVIVAQSMRLIIFAGLLWAAGDLAVLAVKSHHDLRATRILMARMVYMTRHIAEAEGKLPPESAGSREDRGK